MFDRADVIYRYDGSLEGLLCCVFESFNQKETPLDIVAEGQEQWSLYRMRDIVTDPAKAQRVLTGVEHKISPLAQDMVIKGYLSCLPEKEIHLLRFLQLGFQKGRRVTDMLADPTVMTITKAIKSQWYEAHHFMGFLRFSDHEGALIATIAPKNYVLPLMANHFIDRYRNENFLIYDETHKSALIYQNKEAEIIPLEDFVPPAPDDKELYARALWQTFTDAIAIKSRENPRCRMTHCPKRFWKNMWEMPENEPKTLAQGAKAQEMLLPTQEL